MYFLIKSKNTHHENKLLRGNQASFVNNELREAIYIGSRLRSNFYPSSSNESLYKNQELNESLFGKNL